MKAILRAIPLAAAIALSASIAWAQGAKPLKKCASDAVPAGVACIDKYEASVWRVPAPLTLNKGLVAKIQTGKATLAALQFGGATQLGVTGDNFAPCSLNGQNCNDDIYAVSLPGVIPSAYVSWFQAQAACRNSRKRLPTNAEWQAAVVGTQDPGPDNGTTDCNTDSAGVAVPTGSRAGCVSLRGAFDMVGNMQEWVAEWVPASTTCGTWGAGVSPTGDHQCLAGAATVGEPGALQRGGGFSSGIPARSGPLSIANLTPAANDNDGIGFRCAR